MSTHPNNDSQNHERRVRARDLGLPLGRFKTGKYNAITDVEGVLVGHSTIIRGAGPLRPGQGPVRTGVTAILPNRGNIFMERMIGGGFVLNGAGEVSGLTQVMEWGLIETPLLLTNTMSVGAVSDAVARFMVEQYPGIGDEHDVIIPIVGECDDSYLNDIAGRHVRDVNVLEAIRTASDGPVAEGSVGGGTGMICHEFKGGIGTASIQIALAAGAQVIAAASTDEKCAVCQTLGANATVNYSEGNFRDRLKALTDGKGPDVIVDPVGGDLSEQAFRSIAWRGRHLVIGFADGKIPSLPLNLPLLKGASIVGVFWGEFAKREPMRNATALMQLAQWYAQGRIKPVVHTQMAMKELPAAFDLMAQRRVVGKLVLTNN